MTAAPSIQINNANALADVIRIFQSRCWARAYLAEVGEIGFHEAVDVLQHDAERDGLVTAVGQDTVQEMMAAFAKVPVAGQFEADFKMLADCLETITWPRSGAARSTIMAAQYLVRLNDLPRLKSWLAKHSAAERDAIKKYFKERI
jgi:hypothetical protein